MLIIDVVSRQLNVFPDIPITTPKKTYFINHLLYMDDLKLYAKDQNNIDRLHKKEEEIMSQICLNINNKKSGYLPSPSNSIHTHKIADNLSRLSMIHEKNMYKYLGTYQTNLIDQKINRTIIIKEFGSRLSKLVQKPLIHRNLRTSINECCSSLLNYTSGILNWTPNELNEMNKLVNKSLVALQIKRRSANPDRIFMSVAEGGLGFRNNGLEHDKIVIKLSEKIKTEASDNFIIINNNNNHLKTLTLLQQVQTIKEKYSTTTTDDITTLELIEKKHKENFPQRQKQKKEHGLYISNLNSSSVNKKSSSSWLTKTDTSPKVVGSLTAFQDRTIFNYPFCNQDGRKMCPFCKTKKTLN